MVEVRFKGNRKAYFHSSLSARLVVGDGVVVTIERGQDLGYVSALGSAAERKCAVGCDGCDSGAIPEPTGHVLRKATENDLHVHSELRKSEEDVRRSVRDRVKKHSLPMKVSDAEWQWDRKKLTVYFTAENRVDFRELVRDLASLFRTRIELRQIGARDEAKRLTGVGRCGREYCCSTWLPELMPVSLSLAKDQHLSLNPSQISGGCGRLLCCLRYEHDFYVASRKRFPKEGRDITTARGSERVVAVDIFRERILLKDEESAVRAITLVELREEIATRPAPVREDHGRPPSGLTTFDEGPTTVSDERVADAASPRRRSRRRRRRDRGNTRGPKGTPDNRDPEGERDQ